LVTEVLMSAAAVSLTSLLGIRAAGQQLDDLLSMLQGYAYNHDFSELWHRSALKDVGFTLAMFCAAAAMHMGEMPREDLLIDIHRLLRGCAIVVVMAMLMMCSMFLLYILRILVVTVDVFCYRCKIHASRQRPRDGTSCRPYSERRRPPSSLGCWCC